MTPSGRIDTVAGSGVEGYTGDGASAVFAALRRPLGVASARDGTLYIADTGNHVIRHVDLDGTIATVAGGGQPGFFGDGGPASQALLHSPASIFAAADGSLYIGDTGNDRIRRIDPQGNIMTVAGGGSGCCDADTFPTGPATQAVLYAPTAVVVAADGRLVIGDGRSIRVVDSSGTITLLVNGGYARGLAVDPSGYVLAALGAVSRIDASGVVTRAAFPPGLETALFVAAAPDGTTYATSNNDTLARVSPAGTWTRISAPPIDALAGDGGPATRATLIGPSGVATGPDGATYIADKVANVIRRVAPDGSISIFAVLGNPYVPGYGGPSGLAFDSAGNLYVVDTYTSEVRVITPNGSSRALLMNTQSDPVAPWVGVDSQNRIYAVAGCYLYRSQADGTLVRFASLSNTISGCHDTFTSAAVRPDGTVVMGDSWSSLNSQRIASISPDGITTYGVPLYANYGRVPEAMAFDGAGTLYLASQGRIHRISSSGEISTVFNSDLGGLAGEMGLDSARYLVGASALAFDRAGNLVVADAATHRVRRISVNGCELSTLPHIAGVFSAGSRHNVYPDPMGLASSGEIVSIYGSALGPTRGVTTAPDQSGRYPFETVGIRVLVNGQVAPILYASAGQVNAVLPVGIPLDRSNAAQVNDGLPVDFAGAGSARVQVEVNGVASDGYLLLIHPTHPSVFAVVNQDGIVNSSTNPAPQGSVVSLFGTGMGLRNRSTTDGALSAVPLGAPLAKVAVAEYEMLYVGDAPGLIAGVVQINFRVPALNVQTDSNQLLPSLGAPGIFSQDPTAFFLFVK